MMKKMNKTTAHVALKERYEREVKVSLAKELGLKNISASPKLVKIVVNTGIGDLSKDKGAMEKLSSDFGAICGQKPQVRPARVSVSGFSLRAGQPVGLRVTLRGERMYNFFEKLISIVLPRLRDFRGVSTSSFDRVGNYSLGLAEHTVFPEIDLAKVEKIKGLEITIVTNAGNPEKSRKLLVELGMPFEKA